MNLSEAAEIASMDVVRDASFTTLAFLPQTQPGSLVFVEDGRFLKRPFPAHGVTCVIAAPDLRDELREVPGLALASEPRRVFTELHNHLARRTSFYWEPFPTEIHASARIHPSAFVAPQDVRIGPGTVIGPKAVVLERCLIGARVEIRAGAVVGSEGFQTSRIGEDWAELAHAGGILIGDEVQIFANAVIARAVFRQYTTLGRGARVGNLAFVSHNVQVGQHCFVGHGAIVNGCVTIGDEAWIGPGAVVSNSLVVGSRACVSLGSAVIRDVAPGERVTGNVATDHSRYLRHIASL